MLKPRKRLTKKEMKEDKFVTFALEATDFLQRNRMWVVSGIVGVVLVIAVSTVWIKDQRAGRSAAWDLLAEATIAEREGETDRAERLYEEVIENFGRTEARIMAGTSLGDLQFTEGKFDEAMEIYQDVLDRVGDDPLVAFAAYNGVGACLEEQGKYEEAAIHHRSYAEAYPRSPFAPEALSDAARCFVQADRIEEAKTTLEELVRAYPKSQVAYQARSLLKML